MLSSFTKYSRILGCAMLSLLYVTTYGQGVIINMAAIDGQDITPDNIFNFQVQSQISKITTATIKGIIQYRNSSQRIAYSFPYTLRPGMNMIDVSSIHPQWQYSSGALRELFQDYKILPQGTYEYCITVVPGTVTTADYPAGADMQQCMYHRASDIFLINLVDPPNDAKLYEYYPVLSWVVNYPFANALTYRLRVAEIKQGQNPVNAITRNNPVYDERNIMQTSKLYPIYAKPLVKFQPYAWTVDAYYKDVLLGGAETWKFTIIEDTFPKGFVNSSYIDIKREKGNVELSAYGVLKIKYVLEDTKVDHLTIKIISDKNKEIKLKNNQLNAIYGDNRYDIDLKNTVNLKHKHLYRFMITSDLGNTYVLPVIYYNPDFIR